LYSGDQETMTARRVAAVTVHYGDPRRTVGAVLSHWNLGVFSDIVVVANDLRQRPEGLRNIPSMWLIPSRNIGFRGHVSARGNDLPGSIPPVCPVPGRWRRRAEMASTARTRPAARGILDAWLLWPDSIEALPAEPLWSRGHRRQVQEIAGNVRGAALS